MRIFTPLKSAGLLISEPAAHLRARVAAWDRVDVEALVELVEEVVAAAVVEPRVHLARVEAEGDRAAEREGRVLADEVVGRGVRRLDGAVLHRVDGAEGRHELASREDLHLNWLSVISASVFAKTSAPP
jgi:hypothetical protein